MLPPGKADLMFQVLGLLGHGFLPPIAVLDGDRILGGRRNS
jgi:hypothetical protein